MKKDILIVLISVLFSTLVMMFIHSTYYSEKKIFTINMQSIINEYVSYLTKESLDEKTIQERISKFIKKSDVLLKQISQNNNAIIVPNQVIFSGGTYDITNEFKGLVLENAKSEE
jgi:hypothetical protein